MYLSWVPVVGGSLGVVIGGYISDRLVRRWSNIARIAVLAVCTVKHMKYMYMYYIYIGKHEKFAVTLISLVR